MQVMWNLVAQFLLCVICGMQEEKNDEEAVHLGLLHVGVNTVLTSGGRSCKQSSGRTAKGTK